MTIKKSLCLGLIAAMLSTTSVADEQNEIGFDIPLLEDAQVFADFKDKYPVMLNYFTQSSFTEVETFYNQQFGGPIYQQTRYGRLELTYSHMNNKVRVIVAEQNNKREVDIIVEEETPEAEQ